MRHYIVFSLVFLFYSPLFAQNQNPIQRIWIKTSLENLSSKPMPADTLYTRYTFEKNSLKISFSPAWDSYVQTWAINDNELIISGEHYKIETLNDSVLVFSQAGFRRFSFMAEDNITKQAKYLMPIGDYGGKPLYKANNYITPRYTGKESFRDYVQKNVEEIKKASYFLASFIVNEEGKVENVKIINGINESFDKKITKQLLKTSNDWRPAFFGGKPIQTEMFYDIKYLDFNSAISRILN